MTESFRRVDAPSMRTIGMTDTEVCRPGNTGRGDQPRLLVVGVVAVLLCCTAGAQQADAGTSHRRGSVAPNGDQARCGSQYQRGREEIPAKTFFGYYR